MPILVSILTILTEVKPILVRIEQKKAYDIGLWFQPCKPFWLNLGQYLHKTLKNLPILA
jgi:hypothetical protein